MPTCPDSNMRRLPVTTTAWLKPYCTELKTVSGLITVLDILFS